MSISILGGHAKGHALLVPKGTLIRPTSVMLRRRFFDAYQDMSGLTFVDLCAGTGAMGLEALSRGANKVYLNEFHPKVYQLLKKNVSSMTSDLGHSLGSVESSKGSSLDFIKGHKEQLDKADTFIFFDPPYEDHKLYKDVLKELHDFEQAKIIIETDKQKGIKEEEITELNYKIKKSYRQGTSYIYIVE